MAVILKLWFTNTCYRLSSWTLLAKLLTSECHGTPWTISQHWFGYWLGAVRQQPITWANVHPDLCHYMASICHNELTHWGRVTHICVGKLTIIGSDNGLSPGRHQAIIWTSSGILLIGPLGTNFSQILIAIETFSFKKMHLKISSAKWRPFSLGLNVLTHWGLNTMANV